MTNTTLPSDSKARKDIPVLSGCLRYFPAALAGVARWSKLCNDKHNPGEPLHHARGKSMDHGDCILRHTMDLEDLLAVYRPDAYSQSAVRAILDEADARCWRALADAQELHERLGGAPLAPGAKLPAAQPAPGGGFTPLDAGAFTPSQLAQGAVCAQPILKAEQWVARERLYQSWLRVPGDGFVSGDPLKAQRFESEAACRAAIEPYPQTSFVVERFRDPYEPAAIPEAVAPQSEVKAEQWAARDPKDNTWLGVSEDGHFKDCRLWVFLPERATRFPTPTEALLAALRFSPNTKWSIEPV